MTNRERFAQDIKAQADAARAARKEPTREQLTGWAVQLLVTPDSTFYINGVGGEDITKAIGIAYNTWMRAGDFLDGAARATAAKEGTQS